MGISHRVFSSPYFFFGKKALFQNRKMFNMVFKFENCHKIKTLLLSRLNKSQVKNIELMFKSNIVLTSLDFPKIDTSKVTSMSSMFENDYLLESLDY